MNERNTLSGGRWCGNGTRERESGNGAADAPKRQAGTPNPPDGPGAACALGPAAMTIPDSPTPAQPHRPLVRSPNYHYF